MIRISCPKCHEPTTINIAKAVDEHGEVFTCEHCGYQFRFTNK